MATKAQPKQLPLERMTAEKRREALEVLHSLVASRDRMLAERKEAAKEARERVAGIDEEIGAIQGKLAADDAAEEAAR